MLIQQLRDNVDWLRKQLGNGLLATDIWSTEVGLSLAGWNEQPEAVAFFNEVTKFITRAIAESGGAFPGMGRYYLVELEGKRLAIIIVAKELQWGMLIDTNTASLGMVVGVVLQQAVKKLHEIGPLHEE